MFVPLEAIRHKFAIRFQSTKEEKTYAVNEAVGFGRFLLVALLANLRPVNAVKFE